MKVNLKWWGWGESSINFGMHEKPSLLKILGQRFGIAQFKPTSVPKIEQVKIPASQLPKEALQEFQSLLGKEACDDKPATRIRHCFGKSYRDIIRMRSLDLQNAPDIVLFPKTENEIQDIFKICQKYQIALIPFGGGSSVVGGLEPLKKNFKSLAILSTNKFDKIISIDKLSQTATIEAGIWGPDLEKKLQEQGYTLGHFPQSFEFSTLGGWLAARSSGQNSIKYGSIHEMVTSLRVISPQGVLQNLESPAHACGPDLKEILVGSEGTFGVITQAVMKINPNPEEKHYFMLAFPNFNAAATCTREMAQHKLPLALIRISDEEESMASLAMAGGGHRTFTESVMLFFAKKYFAFKGIPLDKPLSLVLLGFEGTVEENQKNICEVKKFLANYHCLSLGKKSGDKWLKDRFFLPYLRDELLDQNLFVETLETVTTWSNLDNLYSTVKNALMMEGQKSNKKLMVLCHISHLYHEGASLYFTIIAEQEQLNLLGQWQSIKLAANQAIKDAGGSISHHHGVGVDHKDFLPWNKLEREMMGQLKNTLDPSGIMNPEKIF